jgi:hypothetical protein
MMIDGAIVVLQRAFLQFRLVALQPAFKRFFDGIAIMAGFAEFTGSFAVREMLGIIKSTDADFVLDGLQLKA